MAGKGAALAMILSARDEGVASVVGGVEKSIGGIGERLKSAFTGLIAVDVMEGLKGIGMAVVSGAVEAADATGRLQAQLGLTKDQAADLGQVAQDVFRSGFGGSVGEVTEVLATVRQNLGDLGPELTQVMAQNAMTIKDLFGASEAESTRTVSVMLKNFEGLSETDAFDIITAGFQNGANFSDEMLDTLREYAPQFSKLGYSADQMMQVLIAGSQDGAFNLDKLGDAMKEFAIRSIDGSKASAEGYALLGLDAEKMAATIAAGGPAAQKATTEVMTALANMTDPVKQNTAGVALFGTQWEDLGPKALLAMNQAGAGLEGFKGKTGDAANASFGLAGQFESLKRQAMGLLIDGITPLMPGFMSLASGAIGSLQSMLGPIREIGSALASIFSGSDDWEAAGSLLDRFFPPEISDAIMITISDLGGMFDAVFAGDIPTAIGAALLVIEDLGGLIASSVESWASSFAAWVDGADSGMMDGLGQLLTSILGWLLSASLNLTAKLAEWGAAFVDWVGPKIPPLLVALGGLLAEVGAWLIGTALPLLLERLAEWGMAFVEWVAPRIGPLLAALGGLLLALGGWLLGTALPAIVSQLLQWGDAFTAWVAPRIPELLLALAGLLGQLTLWIGQQVAGIGVALAAWGVAFIAWVATDVIPALPGALAEIVNAITGWVGGAIDSVQSAARSLGQSFIDGIVGAIRGGYSAVSGAINSIISGALQGAQDDNEVRSPSRKWARELGAPLGQGLVMGLEEAVRPFDAAVSGLTSPTAIRPTAAPSLSGGTGAGAYFAPGAIVVQGSLIHERQLQQVITEAVGGGLRSGARLL